MAKQSGIRCLKYGPKKQYPALPPWPSVIPPSVLTWNDGVVVKLAQVAKRSRRNADLLVLSDALEEAGLDNQHFLSHLRTVPQTVRPYVLYLILGTLPKPRR